MSLAVHRLPLLLATTTCILKEDTPPKMPDDHPPFQRKSTRIDGHPVTDAIKGQKKCFQTVSTSKRRTKKFKSKNLTVRKQLHPSLFLLSTQPAEDHRIRLADQRRVLLLASTHINLNNHLSVQRQQRCSEPTILPAAPSL